MWLCVLLCFISHPLLHFQFVILHRCYGVFLLIWKPCQSPDCRFYQPFYWYGIIVFEIGQACADPLQSKLMLRQQYLAILENCNLFEDRIKWGDVIDKSLQIGGSILLSCYNLQPLNNEGNGWFWFILLIFDIVGDVAECFHDSWDTDVGIAPECWTECDNEVWFILVGHHNLQSILHNHPTLTIPTQPQHRNPKIQPNNSPTINTNHTYWCWYNCQSCTRSMPWYSYRGSHLPPIMVPRILISISGRLCCLGSCWVGSLLLLSCLLSFIIYFWGRLQH